MVQVKKLSKTKRFFEIEVTADVVSAERAQVYAEVAKTAQVPGFRPGRVPQDVLKLRYADSVREEVTKRLIPLHYAKALKESGLRPAGLPQVSGVKMKDDGSFSFSATVEIRPEIKLHSYKGISVKRNLKEVTQSDVDKVIEVLRERNAEYAAIGDRTAEAGDVVICDVEATIGEKPLKKQEKLWVRLEEPDGEAPKLRGDLLSFPEITKGLLGVKPNEQKVIEFTLPEDFPVKEDAKKPAKFAFSVFEVKEKRLPQLNDDFAKSVGGYASLPELREKIKDGLKTKMEHQSKLDLEAQLLENLLKSSDFELPESLLESHRERLYQRMVSDSKHRGAKEEDLKKNENVLLERSRADAARSLRIYFILEEIAQREAIKVEPSEVEAETKAAAERSGQSVEEVKKYMEDNELLDELILEMREKKTIEFLLANAKIENAD